MIIRREAEYPLAAEEELCLVFACADAQHFYGLRLRPSQAFPAATQLEWFVVHAGLRSRLASLTLPTLGHARRLERNVQLGQLHVFLDGSASPLLLACDHTHAAAASAWVQTQELGGKKR